jgi:hypothetical protein
MLDTATTLAFGTGGLGGPGAATGAAAGIATIP